MNSESESPKLITRALGPYRFGRDPSHQQARQGAVGELVSPRSPS